jgi:exosortase
LSLFIKSLGHPLHRAVIGQIEAEGRNLDLIGEGSSERQSSLARIFGTTRNIVFGSIHFWTIVALTSILFWREILRLINAWFNDPYIRYGIMIPVMSVYLIWARRDEMVVRTDRARMGAILCISSIPLLVAVRTYLGLFWTMLPLLLFLFGTVLMFFSSQGVAKIWFPICYLGFMFPAPTGISAPLSIAMSKVTLQLTTLWLKLFGIPHQSTPGPMPTICVEGGGQAMRFLIDISCIGVYALFGFIAFGFFFGYITRGGLGKRVALIVAGALALVLLNTARIAGILGLATIFGEGFAVEASHFLGGWVLIALSFGIILFLAERSSLRIGAGREVE